nr:MAG TPA: hypothetical protein [Caudoviricetes sp.]
MTPTRLCTRISLHYWLKLKKNMKKQKNKSKRLVQRTLAQGVLSIVSLVLSRLFKCVLIVTAALLAVSCHSTKKLIQVSHSERSTELLDSEVVNISTLQMQPVKVPMSAVSLTLNLDTLRLLPLGASYTARQGQASLKVSRKPPNVGERPGQVIIEASCDSLELANMNLIKTVSVLKKRLARQQLQDDTHYEEKKEISSLNSIQIAFRWLLIGIMTGLVLSKIKTIISFIKRRI